MRHPFLRVTAGVRLRADLRRDGMRFWEVNEAIDGLTDDLMDLGIAMAEKRTGARFEGPAGDTPILDWLDRFFDSELGKVLIEVLKSLLLGLLVH